VKQAAPSYDLLRAPETAALTSTYNEGRSGRQLHVLLCNWTILLPRSFLQAQVCRKPKCKTRRPTSHIGPRVALKWACLVPTSAYS